ncbi:hypothetical protein [Paenibacillus massiliensis]|uniref:hypothetical protein n=1 Tax=Paenibacillus massiliensis TaxID=225917 RepID=UPI000470183B|nr:hypothetical protein [Paenibacillus massiliensis]
MATIKHKDKQFNGVVAGVRFTRGVGETDEQKALNHLRARGFEVDTSDPKPAQVVKSGKGAVQDAGSD